ncbi:excinuclease [Photobacterium sp. SDRW27]|uniref:excinuclease n=1 Tax=Photobacterium obscurum TaxID=2829490 RepID=UPI0022434C7B|nr:excinuclease [Photobacterium obscurum]MCW8328833.1 excinuclease [Photobacterium obscurum]
MKKHIALLIVGLFSFSSLANAKDDVSDYSIQDALNTEQAKLKLGSDIEFYFGTQPHGKIVKELGEFKTNKKTNAFNKTDLESCQWVFLSAMIALKDRAVKEGGNAVVDIKSNYKNNLTTSNATFQCGAGTFVSGVALTGKVVKLK